MKIKAGIRGVRSLASAAGLWLASGVVVAAVGCGVRPCTVSPVPDRLGSVCGFSQPEDVDVLDDQSLLLVSNNGRRGSVDGLWLPLQPDAAPWVLWPTSIDARDFVPDPTVGDPACADALLGAEGLARRAALATGFTPHGIAVRRIRRAGTTVVRVAVVDHQGRRDTIQLFDLDATVPRLQWKGCVRMPFLTHGNDLAITPGGDIVVANFQPIRFLPLFYPMGRLGIPTGDVRRWRSGKGWERVAGTISRLPNGVAVTKNGDIFFSETGSGRVWRVPADEADAAEPLRSVDIGGAPDNLWVTPENTVLAATHSAPCTFLWCGLWPGRCASPWKVYEIQAGKRPTARRLLSHDGKVMSMVSSAAYAEEGEGACKDRRYFFGAVKGDRVGTLRRCARRPTE